MTSKNGTRIRWQGIFVAVCETPGRAAARRRTPTQG
jgi:hypothetical protein